MIRCSLAGLAVVLIAACTCNAQTNIYWTDLDAWAIRRADLNGNNVTNVITGLPFLQGLAIDSVANKLYWIEETGGVIRRANLNGTGVETLITGLNSPRGLTLDLTRGEIYWAAVGKIQRAALDGTGLQDVVIGLEFPQSVAVDAAGGQLYWAEDIPSGGPTNDKIRRAEIPVTCCSTPVDVVTGRDNPLTVELDLSHNKIYWAEQPNGLGILRRANVDGTEVQDLVTTDYEDPIDILLDIANDQLYWSDPGGPFNRIRRGDLNGQNPVDFINGFEPGWMALGPVVLIPEPSTLTLSSLVAFSLAAPCRARRRGRARPNTRLLPFVA